MLGMNKPIRAMNNEAPYCGNSSTVILAVEKITEIETKVNRAITRRLVMDIAS